MNTYKTTLSSSFYTDYCQRYSDYKYFGERWRPPWNFPRKSERKKPKHFSQSLRVNISDQSQWFKIYIKKAQNDTMTYTMNAVLQDDTLDAVLQDDSESVYIQHSTCLFVRGSSYWSHPVKIAWFLWSQPSTWSHQHHSLPVQLRSLQTNHTSLSHSASSAFFKHVWTISGIYI